MEKCDVEARNLNGRPNFGASSPDDAEKSFPKISSR